MGFGSFLGVGVVNRRAGLVYRVSEVREQEILAVMEIRELGTSVLP